MRKKQRWLFSVGSLVMAITLIIRRFITMPDSVAGFITGIGIGLMIVGIAAMAKRSRMSRCVQPTDRL